MECSSVDTTDSLEAYLLEVKSFLDDKKQADLTITHLDQNNIQHLIGYQNIKYPGLNLSFELSLDKMADKITQKILKKDSASSRFVSRRFDMVSHCTAFDLFIQDKNLSMIGIDSNAFLAGENVDFAVTLQLLQFIDTIHETSPGLQCKFMIIDSEMQKDHYNCTLFSLFLARGMYKEKLFFQNLHQRHIRGELESFKSPTTNIVQRVDAAQFLPPRFMKHTPSSRRIEEYLKSYEGGDPSVHNKKLGLWETLQERHQRFMLDYANGNRFNNSIEQKRLREIEKTLAFEKGKKLFS